MRVRTSSCSSNRTSFIGCSACNTHRKFRVAPRIFEHEINSLCSRPVGIKALLRKLQKMNLLTNLSLSLFGYVCLTVFGFANETNVASSKPMGKATNSIRLEYWQRKAQIGEVVVRYKGTSPTDFAIALNKRVGREWRSPWNMEYGR